MTNTATTAIVHSESYKGRYIEVAEVARQEGQYSTRAAHFRVLIDGKSVYTTNLTLDHVESEWVEGQGRKYTYTPFTHAEAGKVLKKAIKKGRTVVDQRIADEEIRPSLETVIAYVPRSDKDASIGGTGSAPTDFEVGDRVWFYSRGNIRQGRIEKVGKTNVGVAYVTKKGGQITRMSKKPHEVGSLIENAQQVAEVR